MRVTSPWGGALLLFRRVFDYLDRLVWTLPISLPAALAAFCFVAVWHLLIGEFRTGLVLITGLPAALAAGYYAHKLYSGSERTAEQRLFDWLVLGGIVIWTVFNLLFTSQHLFTNRDPATYNLAGAWLISHKSLQIEQPAALTNLKSVGLTSESLGFTVKDEALQAQGTHVLPTLLGLSGKLVGVGGMLRLNVLFGATALLAFYGFSRLVVRGRWAALGVFIMSLSLPMLFMSRDSYTEPLTMTFAFGGLALLVLAQTSWVRWQWWLSGFVLGTAALTRIDAYLTFAGIVLYAVVLLLQISRAQRRKAVKAVAWLGLGVVLPGYLAWLDVSSLSSNYYHAHSRFILPEFKLLFLLALLGVAIVWLQWHYAFLKSLNKWTTKWRDKVLIVSICGFFLILASRPVWLTGYGPNGDGVVTRNFSEQTMNWIIWYVGPVVAAAAVAGLAIISAGLLRNRYKAWLAFILALWVTAGLYLISPNITGDQIWATRRLLPIVIPGFVLLAMWFFEKLFEKAEYVWRGRSFDLRIITTVLATLAAVSPLFISYPFLLRRLYVPQLSQIEAVCAVVPKDAVIVWAGEARKFAVQPTRTICGNDSLGLINTDPVIIKASLAKIAAISPKPVYVGYFVPNEDGLIPPDDAKPVGTISYNEIEHTYKRPPRNLITLPNTILLKQLTPAE